jgi:hypothetical protein
MAEDRAQRPERPNDMISAGKCVDRYDTCVRDEPAGAGGGHGAVDRARREVIHPVLRPELRPVRQLAVDEHVVTLGPAGAGDRHDFSRRQRLTAIELGPNCAEVVGHVAASRCR